MSMSVATFILPLFSHSVNSSFSRTCDLGHDLAVRRILDLYQARAIIRHIFPAFPIRNDSFEILVTHELEHVLTATNDVVHAG